MILPDRGDFGGGVIIGGVGEDVILPTDGVIVAEGTIRPTHGGSIRAEDIVRVSSALQQLNAVTDDQSLALTNAGFGRIGSLANATTEEVVASVTESGGTGDPESLRAVEASIDRHVACDDLDLALRGPTDRATSHERCVRRSGGGGPSAPADPAKA